MTEQNNNELLSWLQQWFVRQCNGEWEHDVGIRLSTLDNPGWYLEINLKGTGLEGEIFEQVKLERTEDDWIRCWIDNDVFMGACGPCNLTELINYFRGFVEKS